MQIAVVIAIIIVVILIIIGGYLYISSRAAAPAPVPMPPVVTPAPLPVPPVAAPMPEVYTVWGGPGYSRGFTKDGARQQCESRGAKLAALGHIRDASVKGASWCHAGWIDDATNTAVWPMRPEEYGPGCGNQPIMSAGDGLDVNSKFGATCYGVKPKDDFDLLPWNNEQASRY